MKLKKIIIGASIGILVITGATTATVLTLNNNKNDVPPIVVPENEYKIIYKVGLNNEREIVSKIEENNLSQYKFINIDKIEGYNFLGWKLDNRGDVINVFSADLFKEGIKEIILYAVYEKTEETPEPIEPEPDVLASVVSINGKIEFKVDETNFLEFYEKLWRADSEFYPKLEEKTESYEVFNGWFFDSEFKDALTDKKVYYKIGENYTIYPKIDVVMKEKKTISISFDNGVDSDKEFVYYLENGFVKNDLIDYLNALTPEKEGYVFNGWCVNNTSSKVENFNGEITSVKASWRILTYKIEIQNIMFDNFNNDKNLGELFSVIYQSSQLDIYNKELDLLGLFNKEIEPYTFEGLFLDEDCTSKLENSNILIEGEVSVKYYAKFSYDVNISVNLEERKVETPFYYSEKIYSPLDDITISYPLVSDSKDAILKYMSNGTLKQVYSNLETYNDQEYITFTILAKDVATKDFKLDSIEFLKINELIGDRVSFIDENPLDLNLDEFENKGIILTTSNYLILKNKEGLLSKKDDFKNLTTGFNSSLVTTANNVINYDVFLYDNIEIYSLYEFENSIFGRDYILNGDLDLNNKTIRIALEDGDSKTTLFGGINGEIKNGNLKFESLVDIKKDENNSYYNFALAEVIYQDSKLTNLNIDASLGFDFTNSLKSMNFVVGSLGVDVLTDNVIFNLDYKFNLDENSETLRKDNYMVTNYYSPFKTIFGTNRQETTLDEGVEREIKGITINVLNYEVSDYLKNNKDKVLDVKNGDYKISDTMEEKTISSGSHIEKNNLFMPNVDDEYNKGYLTPKIYLFAMSSKTTDGVFCPDGYVANGEGGYVPAGDLVSNSISVNLEASKRELDYIRVDFRHITLINQKIDKEGEIIYNKIYEAYKLTNQEILDKLE